MNEDNNIIVYWHGFLYILTVLLSFFHFLLFFLLVVNSFTVRPITYSLYALFFFFLIININIIRLCIINDKNKEWRKLIFSVFITNNSKWNFFSFYLLPICSSCVSDSYAFCIHLMSYLMIFFFHLVIVKMMMNFCLYLFFSWLFGQIYHIHKLCDISLMDTLESFISIKQYATFIHYVHFAFSLKLKIFIFLSIQTHMGISNRSRSRGQGKPIYHHQPM